MQEDTIEMSHILKSQSMGKLMHKRYPKTLRNKREITEKSEKAFDISIFKIL